LAYKYKIKGYNTTIFNGWTSGLDAIMIAEQLISSGNIEIMIVGAVDTLNETIIKYMKNSFEYVVPGEGAGVLILQSKESAMKNNNRISGYIRDSDQSMFYDEHDLIYELTDVIYKYKDIDYYLANKNGCNLDKYEIDVMEKFGLSNKIVQLKPILGECGAATGILQIIYALKLSQKLSLVTNIGINGRLSWVAVEQM